MPRPPGTPGTGPDGASFVLCDPGYARSTYEPRTFGPLSYGWLGLRSRALGVAVLPAIGSRTGDDRRTPGEAHRSSRHTPRTAGPKQLAHPEPPHRNNRHTPNRRTETTGTPPTAAPNNRTLRLGSAG
ncbi:hypothetical protein Ate01nite_69920 [Actinoplanes teichomyceticus]|nr:hypothetical protein Ate01nite_69920 [Actinoplanes teichomyceticus]